MKCPLCSCTNMELINVKHSFFRHYDYTTIKDSGCVARCSTCQVLCNVVNGNTIVEIDNQLRGESYSLSEQTSHTLIVNDYKEPITRSSLQAELLYKLLPIKQPSILDIGCFDGALLFEFDRRLKFADLYGFDVNEYLCSIFPSKDNIHFLSSDLEEIDGKFDLICMSHSIQYIKNISYITKHIKRLIKSDGLLFVQVPDISKNPCSILFGDQYYFYTPEILTNIFQHSGFKFSLIDNNWFPREIVGLVKPASQSIRSEYIKDSQVYRSVQYLNNAASTLRELPTTSRLGVLGTTVNAAFVDSILGMKVEFFVNEDRNRVGGKFRNKNVVYPESLHDSDLVIIPYRESSQRIEERFANQYRGRFMSL